MERTVEDIWHLYQQRKTAYAERNADIDDHRNLFDGHHWSTELTDEEQTTEDVYQLVVNYCRSVVLHFTGALAAAPRFRVPRPSDAERAHKAEVRERWLAGLRDPLLRAWSDVEVDASKTRCGVLQIIWDPDAPTRGDGDAVVYQGNPFIFRSVDPKKFYPCYRTDDGPNDFFYVIREDPDRLIEDLEEQYGIPLQSAEHEPGTEGACTVVEYWDKDHYYLVALTHRDVTKPDSRGRKEIVREEHNVLLKGGKHTYPAIPFFVLQNIRDPHKDATFEGSLSDVEAVAALNKHADQLLSEHAEEILLQIHRPLVYKTDDPQADAAELVATPGAVFTIGADEDVSPLEWPPEPEMVRNHWSWTKDAIDDMSFLPRTAQGELPAGVSGQSMSIANTPLQRILELKKPRRIETLKAIAAFLLNMAEAKGAPIVTWCTVGTQLEETRITKDFIGEDYYVDITWRNMLPRDEIAYEAHQAYLFKTGVQTLPTTLDKLGIEWVESEVKQLLEEYVDPKINPERAMAYASAVMALKQLEEQKGPPGAAQQPAAPQPGMPPEGAEQQLQAEMQQPGMAPTGTSGAVQGTPPQGALPVRPPAPSFQQMQMEGRLTPFGPREQFGAGALPLRPQGPGVNTGIPNA